MMDIKEELKLTDGKQKVKTFLIQMMKEGHEAREAVAECVVNIAAILWKIQ